MGVKLNPFTGDLQLINGGGFEWALQGILDNFSPVAGTNIIPIGSLVDGSLSTNYSRVDLQEDNPNNWRIGNKLIVPLGLGGWYLITFALSHPTDPILGSNNQVALGDFRVGIRLNGDTKNQAFSVDAGTGTSEAGSFALPIKLQEGDEIEFEFNCNSATNEDFIIRASVIQLGGVATTTQIIQVPSIVEENCLLALSATQDNMNVNSVVNFVDNISGITVNNNMIFNNSTHRITIKSGKTYKVQGFTRLKGISANSSMNLRWYNVTDSVFIGKKSVCSSLNNITDDGEQSVATVIITPSTDIEIEFRVESTQQANNGVMIDATYATVEKISEVILNEVNPASIEWTNFTPIVSAVTTAPTLATTHKKHATFKIVGKSLHMIWSYSHILATGATGGSGDYLFPLPPGYTIDVSKVDVASIENTFGYGTPVGNGHIMQDFNEKNLEVVVYDTTNLKLIAGTIFSNSGWFSFIVNNHKIMFTAQVPIL